MEKKATIELVNFFRKIHISEKDVTTEEERSNGELAVIVTYQYEGQKYTTKKLYYKNVIDADYVKDPEGLIEYYETPVYWLDYDIHKWPKPSKESDLDEIVIKDMYEDGQPEFNKFLMNLANNAKTGKIQLITSDGRTGQYHHNLENNNHWHDIILFVQAVINSKGELPDKKYFSRLVFRWQESERVSLSPHFGNRKIITDLLKNIKSVQNSLNVMNTIDILKYKNQIILQGPPGTGKTYTAKDIAENMIFGRVSPDKKSQKRNLESSEQFKIVQFHPSYTYEDFVRGITARSSEEGIEYITENKILASFAELALKNYLDSNKDTNSLSKDKWIQEKFEGFITNVQNEIAINGKLSLTKNVYVIDVEDYCFRYKGDNWEQGARINFTEFKKLIEHNIGKKELDFPYQLSARGFYRKTYFKPLLTRFFEVAGEYKPVNIEKQVLKPFILIVDEINRANLPSVLGELIYALEYRDETVDSMYELDGDRKIIIPQNLYIIGTMNTADRSVGHIDYAIRRRFAFVDILPKRNIIGEVVKDDMNRKLAEEMFDMVAELFMPNQDNKSYKYLASDFKPEQVQIGHSYFLTEKPGKEGKYELEMKIKYEVVPIVKEYIKDGILSTEAEEIVKKLEIL